MSIRTTVTLDEDVVERLKKRARANGLPFRQVINDVLRSGLLVDHKKTQELPPFRVKPKHMGTIPGLNYDSIEALLEFGEGENHR